MCGARGPVCLGWMEIIPRSVAKTNSGAGAEEESAGRQRRATPLLIFLRPHLRPPPAMEKKQRRHRHLPALLFIAGALLVFFSFFSRHLSDELLRSGGGGTATATAVLNIQSQRRRQHVVALEPDHPTARLPPPASFHRGVDPPRLVADGVLLPAWEALLLLQLPRAHPRRAALSGTTPLFCRFHNGAVSPANFSGVLSSSRRATYRCLLPDSVRRLRPFYVPRLVRNISGDGEPPPTATHYSRELLRSNFLVYEALSTRDDVIVFAKGVNRRRGVDRPVADLRCVFDLPAAPVAAVRTIVTSSSQEVFRCGNPDEASLAPLLAASAVGREGIRISLEIRAGGEGNKVVPSLAEYRPRAPPPPAKIPDGGGKSQLCACTMVYNVAKFLSEWVLYHARLGVERFFLYDNGSKDGLHLAVAELRRRGYNVSSLLWLWPKTQEAGFSHCAAASRGLCEWMMYLDVDEFAFSPSWSGASGPSPAMLSSLLPPNDAGGGGLPVGQVSIGCYEFGPSNWTAHPSGGVTQGYTCRRRAEERHKSIVRLAAVDPTLQNVVHHFRLKGGYRGRRMKPDRAVVNHYKYQAWPEFKAKFRRRASAYVADWTQEVNPSSKDRTPGLGFSAVEPPGWAGRFCEVEDTRLRDTVRRWFGRGPDGETGAYRMEWAEPAR